MRNQSQDIQLPRSTQTKRRPKSGVARKNHNVQQMLSPNRSGKQWYGYDAQLLHQLSNQSSNRNYEPNSLRQYARKGSEKRLASPKTNYNSQVQQLCYNEYDYPQMTPFQQNRNFQKTGQSFQQLAPPQYVQYQSFVESQNQINIAQANKSSKNQMGPPYQENLSYINLQGGNQDTEQSDDNAAIMDIQVPSRQPVNQNYLNQQQQQQKQQQKQQKINVHLQNQVVQQQKNEPEITSNQEIKSPNLKRRATLKSYIKSGTFVKEEVYSNRGQQQNNADILQKQLNCIHKIGVQTPATIQSLNQHFFGALKGCSTEQLIAHSLLKMGFNSENTLFADSSCPDEINHDDQEEDITLLFQNRWGEVFPLAGLAGVPFTGKTGWGAFSNHVPMNGNIVVLFAPHVGIDKDGKVGQILRDGQSCASGACGAAIGAYKALQADETCGDFKCGMHDQQMDTIKHLLKPHYKQIGQSKNEMVTLVYRMYDLLQKYLEEIIALDWMGPSSKLAVCGGIMINCEGEKTDMFLPLQFDVRTKTSKTNLFYQTFGIRDQQRILKTHGIEPKFYDTDEKESLQQ